MYWSSQGRRRRESLPFLIVVLGIVLGWSAAGCGRGESPGGGAAGAGSDTAAGASDTASPAGASPESAGEGGIVVADVGFQTPESVVHDRAGDVYIVSNINGGPLDKDDNGFLSRVSPDGRVLELKWIDGAADDVTLHAPKGLGIHGDSLFVADIDSVRIFGREAGKPLGAWAVPGATFLNDLATGPDSSVYVTDTGLKSGAGGFEPSGTDALYRFDRGKAVPVVKDRQLGAPNGVAADASGLFLVTFGSGKLFRVGSDGTRTELTAMGQLDGVVVLEDGSLALSSWERRAVFRYWPEGERQGQLAQLGGEIESPADIGYDASRKRILVPSFNGNRLESRSIEP